MQKETPWAHHSVYRGMKIESKVECLGYRYVTKYRVWYVKEGRVAKDNKRCYLVFPLLEKVHQHIDKMKTVVKEEVGVTT
jgi:hypothetical protein